MRRSKIMMVCWIVVAVFFGSCDRSPEAKLAKHVKRGDTYAKEEKFKEAVIEYRNAVKAVPNDPQGYILQSGLAVRAGNVDEGIAKLKKAAELKAALSLEPKFPGADEAKKTVAALM